MSFPSLKIDGGYRNIQLLNSIFRGTAELQIIITVLIPSLIAITSHYAVCRVSKGIL